MEGGWVERGGPTSFPGAFSQIVGMRMQEIRYQRCVWLLCKLWDYGVGVYYNTPLPISLIYLNSRIASENGIKNLKCDI